jgi:molybdenum cofactor cytidylyltransferase
MVAWALDTAMATDFRPVVLVVGHRALAVRRVAPPGTVVVRSRMWRRGIAHSLGAALEALDHWARVTAVCVGLADQPLIGAEAYRRLGAAHREGARLAVATYNGVRGNPVLLDRSLWHEARQLRGDVGARALMDRHPVADVDCTGTGDPTDVDTLADLADLERRLGAP